MVILFCKFSKHASLRFEMFSPGQLAGSARKASVDMCKVEIQEKALQARRTFRTINLESMFGHGHMVVVVVNEDWAGLFSALVQCLHPCVYTINT